MAIRAPDGANNHKTHDYILLPLELVDGNCVVLNSILDDKARGLRKESESLGCCFVYFRSVWRELLHTSTGRVAKNICQTLENEMMIRLFARWAGA